MSKWNWMNRRIGERLSIGYGLTMCLMAGLIVLGVARLGSIGDMTGRVIDVDWVESEAAGTINALTNANARNTLELFITTDPAQTERIYQSIDSNKKAISAAIGTLERLASSPQATPVLADIKASRAVYVAAFGKVAQLLKDGQLDEANQLMRGETLPALNALQGHILRLLTIQKQQVSASGLAARQAIVQARQWMLGLGLAVLLIGAAFSVWITRSITGPLREAVRIARRVADGDLSARIVVTSGDETGQLLQALKEMNQHVGGIVAQVRSGTDTIAAGTSQMASGNRDLSARTDLQAGSLEQTASSMEQLTSTVRQNADNARQANALAASASEVAQRGGVVVAQVVDTMASINASAARIADITGVIDGIAFQTNILALNAAVEAARAGEQGRGFAVVASEVRHLAQRSAAAAREIKQLIEASVEQIGAGARLAGEAGGTMQHIVASVQKVNDIIGDITLASAEQTLGIDQVNQAIRRMDQATQQNAVLVQEAAAAAETLHTQADTLAGVVSIFKLDAPRGGARSGLPLLTA
ncbi:MAG: methyl-accepting chemotaxis protein [Pseudomonadota bacterium]